MARNKKPKAKPFESSGVNSDTFTAIYRSMLNSPAFKALKKRQQVLYLYMKAQYISPNKPDREHPEKFYFNKYLWYNVYGLYKNGNSFEADRDALIEHGFIVVSEDGYNTRTKTIYKFSDKWQKYGTTEFKLDYNEMSTSLARIKRAEQSDKIKPEENKPEEKYPNELAAKYSKQLAEIDKLKIQHRANGS